MTVQRRRSLIVLALAISGTGLLFARDAASLPQRPQTPSVKHASSSQTGSPLLQTQDLSTGLTIEDVLAALLGSSSIAISNVTFNGSDSAVGTFTGGGTTIGFEAGIVLSSGWVGHIVGPNSEDAVTGYNNRAGDPDLDSLAGFVTYDASVLEFDFECLGVRKIGFQYVFSSDEYNEFVNSAKNDVFGFFVNGKNIALLPDGQTVVSINTVNGGNPLGQNASNAQYYRNNDECQFSTVPSCPLDSEADGLTVVLIAEADIHPGTNHIKLAIADADDYAYDSHVLLKGQSFVCGAVNNTAPVCSFTPSSPITVTAGTNATFTVSGTDADTGQSIYLSVLFSIPSGAMMTPALPLAGSRTGLSSQFNWVPPSPGSYFANFLLTDSLGGVDSCEIDIEVVPAASSPPVCAINPPGPFTVFAGANLSFTVSGSDADAGQAILLSTFGNLPPGATMNPALPLGWSRTGLSSQFSWTPTILGQFVARFQVRDTLGGSDTCSAQINVIESDAPHVTATIPVGGAQEVAWSQSGRILFSEPIDGTNLIFKIFWTAERQGVLAVIPMHTANSAAVTFVAPQAGWPDDDHITVRILGTVADQNGNTLDGDGDGIAEGSPIDDYFFEFSTAPGVYPGDANDDGIVDERDILPLGAHWLRQGPQRQRNFDIWTREGALAWTPRRATHADCDANGIIDSLDICLIAQFFDYETPAKRSLAEETIGSLSLLNPDIRAALRGALIECDRASSHGKTALLEALGEVADAAPIPRHFTLEQNYPNPFNAGTTIRWESGSPNHVELSIFDILGRRIRTLVDSEQPGGMNEVAWDGHDDNDAAVASGIFFYRLRVGDASETRRMVLIR